MSRLGRHPNSLKALQENREKTQFVAGDKQVEIARRGAEASHKQRTENRAKALEREEIVQVLTQVFNAPILDEKTANQLNALNLPKNLLTKTLYNAVQKAGVNSNMLRVLLELINALKEQQTNVIVNNNNPFSRLSDDELYAEIKRLKNE